MVGGPAHGNRVTMEARRSYLEWAVEGDSMRHRYIAAVYHHADGRAFWIMQWDGIMGHQDAIRSLMIDLEPHFRKQNPTPQ